MTTQRGARRAVSLIATSLIVTVAATVMMRNGIVRGQLQVEPTSPRNDFDEMGVAPIRAPRIDDGYPAPIQAPPHTSVYAGLTNDEVARIVVSKWKERHWASSDTEIVTIANVFASDAAKIGLQERQILIGSEPDIAVIMKGDINIGLPGFDSLPSSPFAMTVIDRDLGNDYFFAVNESLPSLLNKISP